MTVEEGRAGLANDAAPAGGPMMDKLKTLFLKYREPLAYLFFGGCTTLVSIVTYALFTRLFGIQWAGANVLSWVLSVLFAYVTNRTWVFEHRAHGTGPILREMGLFFGCRLLSFFCDMAIMFLCVDVLHINDLIAKVFTQVVVIVLNYVFSKWIIFRGPKK